MMSLGLDDLSQSPEFLAQVEREFGPEASEMNEVVMLKRLSYALRAVKKHKSYY